MTLIDTHCHIYDKRFSNDIEDVIRRAQDSGLSHIITVGTDLKTVELCIELCEKYPIVYATAGIHPHEAKDCPPNYLNELESFVTHPKVVAVGEIGLDYFYNFSDPDIQIRMFREQLEFAVSSDLPAIVHTRDSDDDLVHHLTQSGNRYGVVHSFSGDKSMAEKLIQLDYLISFTGMVTFIKEALPEVVEWIAADKYMIETDSPYLTPKPFRGKKNEPAYVRYIAEKIAQIRHISVEEVAEQTTENALAFFRKLTI
ncbi:MAG: TatD family hydrolase [Candidatus Marinimicrobia bacterium]|jgi:TatD DNase family protein|nr:TatD family hydrolase [Candidatus Neomarinimicrobiota bacterium]MBT3634563.1 TatD family hydrolase [Candidatus Neomarinimicrobiota bacterium]MBT3683356.1 TatD family hydrolase [Candidatus Neomarinimicrobiota bacterium]MBT3760217.1 TatD family hydrolase [Candidatus Neomarinimicrobiota bacterium]MBT3896312.1 TatD family hydrolase [Candidatus Neomarinimicrobiota bacterium]